jgi:hypothetical protein
VSIRALAAAGLLVGLVACGPLYTPVSSGATVAPTDTPASSTETPVPAEGLPNTTAPAVKVLPASSHVTGLPYPASCTAGRGGGNRALPDPRCTPGAASSAVTQANIHTTICVTGYTTKIRPPATETARVKTAAMAAYGEPAATRGTTETDHLVPLETGGSNDVSNLWPEPSDIPGAGYRNTKDAIESALHAALCRSGSTLKLADVQTWIATDWTTAAHKAGLN